RDVVGTLLVDTLYQGKVVLLVEGPSDKMLLHAFSELLASQKKPCINFERIVLQPAYGAPVCPAVASILKNENVPTVALLDSDSEGERIKQKLLDHGLLEEEDIIMLKQAVNPRSRRETIECLIPKHIIVEAVNEVYHPSSKFEKPEGGWWPMVSQLKAWLRKRNLISDKEDLDKITMANIFKKHFTPQEVFDNDENIQEDFRELHTLVEVLRKKLDDKLSLQDVR
ncbi:MAG: TOPRIM nucleotidyl transferase/hydrolase domain-containing protein, partial [candidate division WOR-3 bacterium]|nr:TOPRIM nucleotidyl transferase/hydrolase domain-containing protein [candidate division WOR-3 bacterium]